MKISLSCLLLSTVVFFSCKGDMDTSPILGVDTVFSAKGMNEQLANLPIDEKAKYYIALRKQHFTNEGELDEWMLAQLKADSVKLKDLSEKKVHDLLAALDNSEFNKSSVFFARYIYAHKDDDKYRGVLAHMSKELIPDNNQKDSVQTVLKVYEKGLKYDTTSYIQSGYYAGLSLLHQLDGEYFKAVVALDKAISLANSSDTKNLSILNQNMADLYVNMKYYEKAEFYIDNAISLLNNRKAPLNTLNTYAIIKMRVGKLEEAQKMYLQIIHESSKAGLQMPSAMAYSNLGNVYRRKKDFESALKSYASSDSICKIIGVDIGLLLNQINRAEVNLDQQKPIESERILRQVEAGIMGINNPSFNSELYRLYAEVYSSLGKTSLSDHYFRKYSAIKEDVMGDQTKTIIAEWELSNEREKITQKEAEMNVKIQKERDQKLMMAMGGVFMLVLGILFYLNRRKKQLLEKEHLEQEKQKLAFDLELKSKELLAESVKSLSVLNTKNEIYEDLSTVVSELPGAHQQKFSKLLQDLRSTKEQSVLDEFETRFLGVYEDFYKKIKKVAPDITPTEVRICALMRLNMSTKEIAMLTSRTVGTIDNARSKIRKKLNLSDEDNLQTYIAEL